MLHGGDDGHEGACESRNPLGWRQLPGIGPQPVDAIVTFRTEHRPIQDAAQLAAIIGAGTAEQLAAHADFASSNDTAPEAPGA